MAASTNVDQSGAAGRRPRSTLGPVPLWLTGALILGAWAVATVTYLLHVAWLVPLVVLLGGAALLRGGRGLLDRIVMAAALLYGALCAAGLVFSVWPWHLHPIAVGGVALTGLVIFGVLAGRRPHLPRPTLAEGLTVAAAGLVGLVYALPFLRGTDESRLATMVTGEDGFRHFLIMDTIRQLGGYLFLHREQALQDVYTGVVSYPQGGHLFFGLMDNFARSSTQTGAVLDGLDHYLAFSALAYTAFALAVIWAVTRLADRQLTPARRLALVAVAVCFLLSNGAFFIIVQQYTPQILGLAIITVLVAVLARPPARTEQTLWLVAALMVGLGFTYYLYLPPAGLVVLAWFYARRRLLARHRWVFGVVFAATALSAVPFVLGVVVARQDSALLIAADPPSVDGLLVLVGVAVAGLALGWRTPRWRVLRWALGAASLALVLMYAFQRLSGGAGGYYYANKMLDLVDVLLVLAAGSLLLALPAPRAQSPDDRSPRHRSAPGRTSLRPLVPAVAVVVALAAGSGLVAGDSPYQPDGAVIARGWAAGAWDFHHDVARIALTELDRDEPPGTLTVVVREDPESAYVTQTVVSVLLRQYGAISPGLNLDGLGAAGYRTPDWYDRMVEALAPHPLLVVVDTDASLRAAEQLRDRHPAQQITIVRTTP